MLLAIDIGSTHTVIGVYAGDSLRAMWRIATNQAAADEAAHRLLHVVFPSRASIFPGSASAVASVVPN